MTNLFMICCKPGDVFYGTEPKTSPRKVRRYKVLSIEIYEDDVLIYCKREDEDDLLPWPRFREWEFKRIMYRTRLEAKASAAPPYLDSDIWKLDITSAFK